MSAYEDLSALAPRLAGVFLKRELAKAASELVEGEQPLMVSYANVRYPSSGSGLCLVVATNRRLLLARRLGSAQEEVTSLAYDEISVAGERAGFGGAAIEIVTLGALPQGLRVDRDGETYAIRGVRPLRRAGPMLSLVQARIQRRGEAPPDSEGSAPQSSDEAGDS